MDLYYNKLYCPSFAHREHKRRLPRWGPFSLQAWKRLFFVCFIDFFALLSARFNFKCEKINKRKKERMLFSTLVVEMGL